MLRNASQILPEASTVRRGRLLRGLLPGQGCALEARCVKASGLDRSHPLNVALPPAAIFADIRQTLQSAARIGRRTQQVPGAIQAHQPDAARFVDRHARAAMRAEILAPIVGTYFVSDPQPPLRIVGDRRISFVKRRRGHRDFVAPLARRGRCARIDIVTAIAVRIPSYGHSSR